MNPAEPFLALEASCEQAVAWFSEKMRAAGLQVLRTFDLQAARAGQGNVHCPRHPGGGCTCQVVVMLVYGAGYAPVSLVVQECGRRAWFELVDTPEQRADPALQAAIRQALACT